MATLVVPLIAQKRAEDLFFNVAAYLMLAIVVIGFAPSYFLRGAVFATLPTPLVHLHGAVFSAWIILFAVQSSLIPAKKIRIHRRLGVLGAIIAGLMVIFGIVVTFDMLRRGARLPSIFTPASFLISNVIGMLCFGAFVAFAIWKRNDRVLHKRTMFVANAILLPPAIFRMTIYPFMQHHMFLIGVIPLGFIAALLIFDIVRLKRPLGAHAKPVLATLVLGFLFWVMNPLSDIAIASKSGRQLTAWAQHHP